MDKINFRKTPYFTRERFFLVIDRVGRHLLLVIVSKMQPGILTYVTMFEQLTVS